MNATFVQFPNYIPNLFHIPQEKNFVHRNVCKNWRSPVLFKQPLKFHFPRSAYTLNSSRKKINNREGSRRHNVSRNAIRASWQKVNSFSSFLLEIRRDPPRDSQFPSTNRGEEDLDR